MDAQGNGVAPYIQVTLRFGAVSDMSRQCQQLLLLTSEVGAPARPGHRYTGCLSAEGVGTRVMPRELR